MNFLDIINKLGSKSEDEEEDNDYVPQKKELEEYEREKNKGKKKKNFQKDIQKREQMLAKQWIDMKQQDEIIRKKQYNSNTQLTHQELKSIAEKVLTNLNKEQQEKKVYFAGKEFLIDANGNICETKQDNQQQNNANQQQNENAQDQNQDNIEGESAEIKKNRLTLQELKKSFQYQKFIIDKINSKAKSINSLIKSKLDWKAFAKQQKLEKQFEYQRKAGYLENQEFLAKVKESEKENRKKPKLNSSNNQ